MLTCSNSEIWPDVSTLSDVPPSVLVVDDDAVAADELAEALELEGFHCITANTADQAMSILHSLASVSVLITDFYLSGTERPVSNGLGLIDKIQESFPQRNFDFIVVSGDQDVLADCVIGGAGKFLSKPVAPESICSMVREASSENVKIEALADSSDPLSSLHRMIQNQADTITTLTDALNSTRSKTRNATNRMDRLVSAASIAKHRNESIGATDIDNLLGYIVGQGYAIKNLLGSSTDNKTGKVSGSDMPTTTFE